MSTKRKRQQQNFLTYAWNEFLFAREFEYETPLIPGDIGDLLKRDTTGHQRKSKWYRPGLRNTIAVSGSGDKQRTFKIRGFLTPSAWAGNTISAQATGTIEADREKGLTVVRGKVTFGRAHHLLLTIGALFCGYSLLSNASSTSVNSIVWLGVIGIYWWQAWRDRNLLAEMIDDAVMNAKAQSAASHLQDIQPETMAYSTQDEDKAVNTKQAL